jgi:hypothetical protein
MSLDTQNASTMDGELTMPGIGTVRSRSSRRQTRSTAGTASSISSEVIPSELIAVRNSTIEATNVPVSSYEIDSDAQEFGEWLARTRAGALLDVVATMLAQSLGLNDVIARLETEVDAPDVQRVHVIARTSMGPEIVLPKLFDFTGSAWWLNVARNTRGNIVVDVEFD